MHEDEGSVWDQYYHLLTNPAHWAFEITLIILFDVIIALLLFPLIKKGFNKWLARHDKEVHGHDHKLNPTETSE